MKLSKIIMSISLVGIVFSYLSDPFFQLTGFAISLNNSLEGFSSFNFIFLISLSLFLFTFVYSQSSGLEKRTYVWEENGVAYFNDTEGQICPTNPKVSLEDFKSLVEEFKGDTEIYSTIKSAYAPFFLTQRELSLDKNQRGLVQKFLDVLDLRDEKDSEEGDSLELGEKLKESKNLFREHPHTDFSRNQKAFFDSLGFSYGKHKKNHLFVEDPNTKKRITTSATSGDRRSGMNFTSELGHLIREHYQTLNSQSEE
jgi:hypothetical protein